MNCLYIHLKHAKVFVQNHIQLISPIGSFTFVAVVFSVFYYIILGTHLVRAETLYYQIYKYTVSEEL